MRGEIIAFIGERHALVQKNIGPFVCEGVYLSLLGGNGSEGPDGFEFYFLKTNNVRQRTQLRQCNRNFSERFFATQDAFGVAAEIMDIVAKKPHSKTHFKKNKPLPCLSLLFAAFFPANLYAFLTSRHTLLFLCGAFGFLFANIFAGFSEFTAFFFAVLHFILVCQGQVGEGKPHADDKCFSHLCLQNGFLSF